MPTVTIMMACAELSIDTWGHHIKYDDDKCHVLSCWMRIDTWYLSVIYYVFLPSV